MKPESNLAAEKIHARRLRVTLAAATRGENPRGTRLFLRSTRLPEEASHAVGPGYSAGRVWRAGPAVPASRLPAGQPGRHADFANVVAMEITAGTLQDQERFDDSSQANGARADEAVVTPYIPPKGGTWPRTRSVSEAPCEPVLRELPPEARDRPRVRPAQAAERGQPCLLQAPCGAERASIRGHFSHVKVIPGESVGGGPNSYGNPHEGGGVRVAPYGLKGQSAGLTCATR